MSKSMESGKYGDQSIGTGLPGRLSLVATTVFIVGELAGSGVLALPSAVASSGWWGAISIIICCVASGLAGVYLGRCWLLIEENYPEYRDNSHAHPYSIIALKAVGPKMSTAVTANVLVQLFGVAIVFLLLSSNLFHDIMQTYQVEYFNRLSSCHWIILIGCVSCPFMWLPSPAEITFVAYTAMSCTAISSVLLLIIYSQQDWTMLPVPAPIELQPFCLSLGTIAFAFGGTATFPTFQNFMKNRHHFPYAVSLAFLILLIIYLPVAVGGYVLYASGVKNNILDNLPDSGLKTAVNLLMAFHVFAALLIVINPVNMSFEQFLKMPCGKLSLNKCILRTIVCLAMTLVGLSIPKFGKIVNLVGAIGVSTTSFMFPPLFYLRLERSASGGTTLLCYSIAALGLVGGIVAMYTSVKDVFDAFDKPCYA